MSSKAFSDSGVQARAFLLFFLPSSRPTYYSLVRGVFWFDFGTVLFLENPKIRQTLFCAGSLSGAPNRTKFKNSKTKTLFKDIEVLYTTLFTATGILLLHMYSQTAVRLPLRRSLRFCCSRP